VTGAVPATGFETAIGLKQVYADVAVQALNAQGRVLKTSAAVVPGAG
jgi:hypothetical protein